MPLHQGAVIDITAEKPVAGGRMLARHDGQIVFVAGTIPGERVRARIDRVSRNLAFAETVEVVEPSPDRRSLDADWACGGSHYRHIAYARQVQLKSALIADAFGRLGKIVLDHPIVVMPSEEQGYRMRARLHAEGARFGFFREGTHQLCDAGATLQLLPATIAALSAVAMAVGGAGVAIDSCDVVENAEASERAVYVELAGDAHVSVPATPVSGVTGLAVGAADASQESLVYGSPFVTDRFQVAGTQVELTHHVRSFFQANRYLVAPLVERVIPHVPGGSVFDLYAGVGLFAVVLASLGRTVVAVEGDRFSARDLASNAAPLGSVIHVEATSVELALERRRGTAPDSVLLDPPRTGVSPEAMAGLLALNSPRIVYVSCDAPTLARDARRLIDAGYALTHVEAFDLFPNTSHVETLAVFDRRAASASL